MHAIRSAAVAVLFVSGLASAQTVDDRYTTTSLGRTLRSAEGLKSVRRVEPVPPRSALERGIQGAVVVEALVDTTGKVAEVTVVKSLPGGLTEATVDAVKQWTYEPYREDGQPIPVLTRVTINFGVSQSPSDPAMFPTVLGMTARFAESRHAPRPLKRVNPNYPEAARAAGTRGRVELLVLVDEQGKVVDVTVLRGLPNGLTEATISAVRQWRYKPFARDGKTWPMEFPVTIDFKL